MLIRTTYSKTNNVVKATVTSEPNSLDSDYMKAYGEPIVVSGGALGYEDATRKNPSVTTSDALTGVEADVPNTRTVFHLRHNALNLTKVIPGDELVITGTTFDEAYTVLAVDEIHDEVAVDATGISTVNPFTLPVNVGTLVIGAYVEGQALAGVVDGGVNAVLYLKSATEVDFDAITVGVDSVILSGVTLATQLNGTHLITAKNAGAKTLTIASVGATTQNPFVVSVTKGNIVHNPAPTPFTLPAANVYIRSSSPFETSLSSAIDTNAEAKVVAWAHDLVTKISTATTTLRANPNPNAGRGDEVTEL
jgi:hypothetical protein